MDWRPDRSWYSRDARELAPALLGAHIHSHKDGVPVSIRLTEVEAYCGSADPGSHAYRGETKRTAVMFGPPGHLYVYFSYGMHWCMNVVCGATCTASAVLLRAGEVVSGLEAVRERRVSARRDIDLARGPARLATALGLDGSANGLNLLSPQATVQITCEPDGSGAVRASQISTGGRVGVSGPGGDGDTYPWRLWITSDPTVSQYRPGKVRRR